MTTGSLIRRVQDIDIHSPVRLLTPSEQAVPHEPATITRVKDRISYSHQLFTIDLTQVSNPARPAQLEMHELEIEFKDARVLLKEAKKEAEGRENQYLEMVTAFLNNISEWSERKRVSANWFISG